MRGRWLPRHRAAEPAPAAMTLRGRTGYHAGPDGSPQETNFEHPS